MTAAPRWIIVDDADSRIQYNGLSWFPDKGNQDSHGHYGPPFRSTLHGTQANASLSLTFHGTQVRVLDTLDIRNNSGVLDPTWQCFIDNVRIDVDMSALVANTSEDPDNQQVFCSDNLLLDGPHIITVNATVQNRTFWFDSIHYVPSASVPLDQEAIYVNSLDPQLQYGRGQWDYLFGQIPDSTSVTGATLNFSFIGVSLGWYGLIPNGDYNITLPASRVTYSIDGQTPINFQTPSTNPNTDTLYLQKLFETAQLPAGPHTLNLVYHGSNNSSPLSIQYLIIQNGTLPSTTTLPSTLTLPSTTSVFPHATPSITGSSVSGTSNQRKSSTPVGAIVGGVVGGLALTVFIVFGFLLLRRRKRATEAIVISSTPHPFNHTPLHPSNTTLNPSFSGGISHSQSPQITHMGNAVTYGTKRHIYGSIPSLNASPDAIAHSTNLRPVPPLQQSSLATINPLLSTLPLVASRPSPLSLPTGSETNREAEGPAGLGPQPQCDGPPDMVSMQNNGTRSPPNVRLHEDSGIRMPPSTPTTGVLIDVPPLYTAD
ncbi:hypothetical protein BYT27DRAFT_7334196 [Phlegmacium glaucopus]|nr:hypothetical protein BYT27DRAFT_7164077 [Phlegmacium glaucopus]KAF8814895.1 hypothetical protein BYT27DRAFT_7334196 [Phlegmacium glaucopus]